MAIKFKHTCFFNDYDFIEVDVRPNIIDGVKHEDLIVFTTFDDSNKTTHVTYLDKKTAIRFAKSIRTEINKIQ